MDIYNSIFWGKVEGEVYNIFDDPKYFYHADGAARLHDAVQQQTTSRGDHDVGLMTLQIKDFLSRKCVMSSPDISISAAAKKMTEETGRHPERSRISSG